MPQPQKSTMPEVTPEALPFRTTGGSRQMDYKARKP